jgi:hypothetical protein
MSVLLDYGILRVMDWRLSLHGSLFNIQNTILPIVLTTIEVNLRG